MWTSLLKFLIFSVGWLSWRRSQKLGAVFGLIWFHIVRIRRRTVLHNLRLAIPEQGEKHLKIARNAYRHFGISAMEFLKMTHMTRGELSNRVRSHGMEHYQAALSRGKGVIVVTAHFGNFDLLACSQAAKGIPLAIVSQSLHMDGINGLWMKMRRAKGLEIFPEQGAARHVLGWLRSGHVLGLTVDQRISPERGGILADFMGHRVWTTTAPAALARRTGAALLPVRIERGEDGNHNLIVEPEIVVDDCQKGEEIEMLTERINRVVAGWVRQRPDHWMWLHRRFVGSIETDT
jgi:KDO2-lipid IV(A) lauroyltransferase